MGDKNVNRFCELIVKINEKNEYLKQEKYKFYDGGYSFDECYKFDIKELIKMQDELKVLIKLF